MITQSEPLYVRVAVFSFVWKAYDYKWVSQWKEPVPGTLIKVPLGKSNRGVWGCITALPGKPDCDEISVKEAMHCPEHLPPLPLYLLKLADWMMEYYGCPPGVVYKTMVPSSIFKIKKIPKDTECLPTENVSLHKQVTLNAEQNDVVEKIKTQIDSEKFYQNLLHGITGSGKTEVYLQLIRHALSKGRSALLIVPEIALTPQMSSYLQHSLREELVLFHSRLSDGERCRNWIRVARGEVKVVVGARSAVFAPLKFTGIIIVDEEHEKSYKQDESPLYNCRDIALVRGQIESCPVLLGSATPSLESYYNVSRGKYLYHQLSARAVKNATLPELHIVDMQEEMNQKKSFFTFSSLLVSEIEKALKHGDQVMLFLNQRGFNHCFYCLSCKMVQRCPHCHVALTEHRASHLWMCHRCEFREKPRSICMSCKAPTLKNMSVGTEKIENYARQLFPGARIDRIDTDSIRKKGQLDQKLEKMHHKEIDILIGTQMIAKGLDIKGVTLVGILNADLALNLPDFRSGEQTFQLITQVAGRAGRQDKKGKVVVQTFLPEHPIIKLACNNQFSEFSEYELKMRKQLKYPPFSQLILIEVAYPDEVRCAKIIHELSDFFVYHFGIKAHVRGPFPAPVPKIKNNTRFQFMILIDKPLKLGKYLMDLCQKHFAEYLKYIRVDVDPQNLL